MNIPTDLKLKIAISKQLDIDIFRTTSDWRNKDSISFFWRCDGATIKETEWNNIVHSLESKLEASDHLDYIRYLRMYHEQNDDLKTIHWFAVINSSWQIKATCLFLARGITV